MSEWLMIDLLIKRIREWRLARRMPHDKFAGLAGLDRQALDKMDDANWNPKAETLRRLERAIDKNDKTKGRT